MNDTESRTRYLPHEDPRLVVCRECSKPNDPAVIPADTQGRHDLWHDLLEKSGGKR